MPLSQSRLKLSLIPLNLDESDALLSWFDFTRFSSLNVLLMYMINKTSTVDTLIFLLAITGSSHASGQSGPGLRGRELSSATRVLGLRVARCRVGKSG